MKTISAQLFASVWLIIIATVAGTPLAGYAAPEVTARGEDVTVPVSQRDNPVTVIELTLDQPVLRGQQIGLAVTP